MQTLLTKPLIAYKLTTEQKWLERGILAIYKRQTDDEQATETTNKQNGMGFTGVDAKFGSSLAKQLLNKRPLSIKQLIAARKMMKKYAGQLLQVVKEKPEPELAK